MNVGVEIYAKKEENAKSAEKAENISARQIIRGVAHIAIIFPH